MKPPIILPNKRGAGTYPDTPPTGGGTGRKEFMRIDVHIKGNSGLAPTTFNWDDVDAVLQRIDAIANDLEDEADRKRLTGVVNKSFLRRQAVRLRNNVAKLDKLLGIDREGR